MGLGSKQTELHSEEVHLAAQRGKFLRRRAFGGAGRHHLALLGDMHLDSLEDLGKDVFPVEEAVHLQALQAVAVSVRGGLQAVDLRQILVEGMDLSLDAPAGLVGVLDDGPQVQTMIVNFGETSPGVDPDAVWVRTELDLVDEPTSRKFLVFGLLRSAARLNRLSVTYRSVFHNYGSCVLVSVRSQVVKPHKSFFQNYA